MNGTISNSTPPSSGMSESSLTPLGMSCIGEMSSPDSGLHDLTQLSQADLHLNGIGEEYAEEDSVLNTISGSDPFNFDLFGDVDVSIPFKYIS